MKVFGPTPWGNWTDKIAVQAPVGESCQLCGELIREADLGVVMPFSGEVEEERPWHRDCLLYSILGKPEDERGALRSSAIATRLRVDSLSSGAVHSASRTQHAPPTQDSHGLFVMHSAPLELGVVRAFNDKSLCGIVVGTRGAAMTRCLPSENMLGHNQAGCPACIDAFEQTGGKSLWRRAAT